MINRLDKLLGIAFLLLIFSCKHEPIAPAEETNVTPLPPVITDNPCDPDSAYFQVDILPLLRSNCAFSGCHGGGSSENGVELSNYNNVMQTADVRPADPEGSDLYEMITETDPDKRMPQPPYAPLSAEQISMVRKWIEQGQKTTLAIIAIPQMLLFQKMCSPLFKKTVKDVIAQVAIQVEYC